MSAEPQIPLRRLADFNPAPPGELRGLGKDEIRLLPMDAVQHFDPPGAGVRRPIREVLQGYTYVEPQDVAYAKVTPCFENGKGLVGRDLDAPVFATSELTVIRPGLNLDQGFLSYVLRSEAFRGPAIASMTGAGGLKRVNEKGMASQRIWCPPLAEQRAIADYLDHETAEIDAFINDEQQIAVLLEERELAQLELLMAPEEASWVPLKRLGLTKAGGYSANGADFPAQDSETGVLKTGAVSKGLFDPSENKLVDDPAEQAKLVTPVRRGAVIVNRANTPHLVGSLVAAPEDRPNLFLSDLLWEVDVREMKAEMLAYFSRTKRYREFIELISVGASSTMKKIRFEDFARLEVPVFTRERESAVLEQLNAATENLRSALDDSYRAVALAKERRAALISAAVTGQLDVSKRIRPEAERIEDEVRGMQ